MSCDSSGLCDIIDYHQFWLYFGLLLWLSSPSETSPKTTDQSTMTAPRVYQPYQLMQVRNSATNRLLLPSVCQRIKDLGIKKSTRGCSDCVTTRLDVCFLHPRSIKNKAIDLLDYTVDHELGLFFFTETWLGHITRDQTISGILCPAGYFFLHTSRKTRRGGGVGILYRSTLNIRQLDRVSEPSSYKCLECRLTSDSTLYRTLLVHRSPTALSTLAFLEEFSDHLDETVYSGGNLIVLGDFNFHVDDTSDADATMFIDMIEAYSIAQHASVSTHKNGALKGVLKTHLIAISFN